MTETNEVMMDKVDDGLDWRNLKSMRQKRPKFKDYQEELLEETPGAFSRTNVAMHAVIDVTAAGFENRECGMGATSGVRNQALIHYIARLACSNSDSDEFDFSFVESLLENGADINTADRYGQTMFHEVARSWNIDVARFLLSRGASINQQDNYGRAPLHVASAVDYTEMIEFLLRNGAKISITTFGELQSPIHFAAKNDACQALKLLINHGASIHCRDYQNRTPLQVAASMSRSKAARYLVDLGAPTGLYDHNGEMTLSLLILKMPEVAIIALDQFRSQDMINRKEYHFLNYIEGPRIYDRDPRENKARSPLEVAIQHEQYGIIMHPVMKRLINNKWEQFGKKGAQSDLIINVIFAFIWTILGITMPKSADQLYSPLKNTWWRLAFAIIAICLTGLETLKQISNLIFMNRAIRRWKTFRQKTLKNDKRFCHPQWKDENDYLDKEIKIAEEERLFSKQDGWIFLDWIALIFIVAGLASHISFLVVGSQKSRDIHVRVVAFLLIVFWLRLLKFARPFKEPGPFVASIGPMLRDFIKWSILFTLLFIPYAAIFWMIFGQDNNDGTTESPFDIPGLLFTVFTMAAFSNLTPIHDLESIDKNMARVLTSSFVAISTIMTLNLLIAMLADTFTRMYENSLETATMQRAKTILYLEQTISSNVWAKYCEHIIEKCSPEVTCLSEDVLMGKRDKIRLKDTLHRNVSEIHSLVSQRFARRIGSEKSDIDRLLEGFNMLNNNLMSMMQSMEHGESKRTRNDPTVLNLNIVLEESKGKNLRSSGQRRKNDTPTPIPRCWITTKEKGGKAKVDSNRDTQMYLRSLSMSSHLSSHAGGEPEEGNFSVKRQICTMLDLMKEALNSGKLNIGINRQTLVDVSTREDENANETQGQEETEEPTDDVVVSPGSEKDWALYEAQLDGGRDDTVMLTPVLNARTNRLYASPQNSLDTSDVGQRNNGENKSYSPGGPPCPTHVQRKSSSSSSEGTARYDDFTAANPAMAVQSFQNLTNEAEGSYTIEDTDSETGTISSNHQGSETDSQRTGNDFHGNVFSDVTDNNGDGSQTDSGSRRGASTDFNGNRLSDAIDSDCVSSSFASDASNQYLGDNIVTSQSEEANVDFTPNSSQEIITRATHVTWADDVGNVSGTLFVNIRELSTSPSHSENFSSETHTDECAGSDAGISSDV